MEIKQLPTTDIVKNSQKTIKKTGSILTSEPDSFEKKVFDINAAIKDLGNIPDANDKSNKKFNNCDLSTLSQNLKETPEKWGYVKSLASNPNISARNVVSFSYSSPQKLEVIDIFSKKVNSLGKPVFEDKDLSSLSFLIKDEECEKVKLLANVKMNVYPIIQLVKQKYSLSDFENISKKFQQLETSYPKDVVESQFKESYDKKSYILESEFADRTIRRVMTNKDFKTMSTEETSICNNGKDLIKIKKANDFRNNITTKSRFIINEKEDTATLTNEIKVSKDKNGKVLNIEYMKPSEIPGVYDIRREYPNGKTQIISLGKIDSESGTETIIKDMKSLDGTRTEYRYEDTPNGDRIMDYKITDKDGKVLLKKSATFEVVNDKKFISSKNDDMYEITIDENGINVQGLTDKNKKASLKFGEQIKGYPEMILDTLKQMPAEELIKLAENTKTLIGTGKHLDSEFDNRTKNIKTEDNLSSILHELGHAVDYKNVESELTPLFQLTKDKAISSDKEFAKVFEAEKELFLNEFAITQRDYVDYFINDLTHYGGDNGGKQETVAESNMILSTVKSMPELATRVQYLQQYFPRTIAYISTKLDNA